MKLFLNSILVFPVLISTAFASDGPYDYNSDDSGRYTENVDLKSNCLIPVELNCLFPDCEKNEQYHNCFLRDLEQDDEGPNTYNILCRGNEIHLCPTHTEAIKNKFTKNTNPEKKLVSTKTGFGCNVFYHSYIQDRWLTQYHESPNGKFLDIGSGIGANVFCPPGEKGRYGACDRDSWSLLYLLTNWPKEQREKLILDNSIFPEYFRYKNTFDGILASYLFNYLTPKEMDDAIPKLYAALNPGGKLFIIVFSPFYLGFLGNQDSQFVVEQYKKSERYPGLFTKEEQAKLRLKYHVQSYLPNQLAKILRENGFVIEDLRYFDCMNDYGEEADDFPEDLDKDDFANWLLDYTKNYSYKYTSVGIVAVKPE